VTRADRLSEPAGATTHYPRSAPARSGRFRLPNSIAFTVAAVAFTSVLAAAGTPAPLYVVYQERFHIPDAGLTAAFAIYILPVVAVLLCGGRLSDHVGRRPVAVLAPLLGLAACLVFMHVQGLGALLLGRGLQGLATGLGDETTFYVIRALLARTGIKPDRVSEVIMGQVLTAGAGRIPRARPPFAPALPRWCRR